MQTTSMWISRAQTLIFSVALTHKISDNIEDHLRDRGDSSYPFLTFVWTTDWFVSEVPSRLEKIANDSQLSWRPKWGQAIKLLIKPKINATTLNARVIRQYAIRRGSRSIKFLNKARKLNLTDPIASHENIKLIVITLWNQYFASIISDARSKATSPSREACTMNISFRNTNIVTTAMIKEQIPNRMNPSPMENCRCTRRRSRNRAATTQIERANRRGTTI